MRLQANLIGDDYIWRWTGLGRTQSTFYGVPLAAEQLSKRAADHVPVLGMDGEIDLFVLARMQDSMPLGDIARELLARFPSAMRDRNTALGPDRRGVAQVPRNARPVNCQPQAVVRLQADGSRAPSQLEQIVLDDVPLHGVFLEQDVEHT